MPSVRTFKPDEMLDEGIYLLLMDTGVLQVKSSETNKIVTTINPSTPYENQLSKGGLAKAEAKRSRDVDELLEALGIDVTEASARFLANQALTSTRGGNLSAFTKLLDLFTVEAKVPRPIWQICLSDRAYTDYLDRMVRGTTGMAEWMQEEELAKTPDFENILPRDNLEGKVEKVIRVRPKDDESVPPEHIFNC